jgi:hypothetical protein
VGVEKSLEIGVWRLSLEIGVWNLDVCLAMSVLM